MTQIDYTRQSGLVDQSNLEKLSVAIIGCGATGSFVAVALAKMGVGRFILYDRDTIESHNLPNQFFTTGDLGRNKAAATKELIELYNPEAKVFAFTQHYLGGRLNADVVITAVDSMRAREAIYAQAKDEPGVKLLIDPRSGGMAMKLFVFDPHDRKERRDYENMFYFDESASEDSCTARAIIFTVMQLSGFICRAVARFSKGQKPESYILYDNSLLFIDVRKEEEV